MAALLAVGILVLAARAWQAGRDDRLPPEYVGRWETQDVTYAGAAVILTPDSAVFAPPGGSATGFRIHRVWQEPVSDGVRVTVQSAVERERLVFMHYPAIDAIELENPERWCGGGPHADVPEGGPHAEPTNDPDDAYLLM